MSIRVHRSEGPEPPPGCPQTTRSQFTMPLSDKPQRVSTSFFPLALITCLENSQNSDKKLRFAFYVKKELRSSQARNAWGTYKRPELPRPPSILIVLNFQDVLQTTENQVLKQRLHYIDVIDYIIDLGGELSLQPLPFTRLSRWNWKGQTSNQSSNVLAASPILRPSMSLPDLPQQNRSQQSHHLGNSKGWWNCSRIWGQKILCLSLIPVSGGRLKD